MLILQDLARKGRDYEVLQHIDIILHQSCAFDFIFLQLVQWRVKYSSPVRQPVQLPALTPILSAPGGVWNNANALGGKSLMRKSTNVWQLMNAQWITKKLVSDLFEEFKDFDLFPFLIRCPRLSFGGASLYLFGGPMYADRVSGIPYCDLHP